jgi:GxxExxY protein
MDNLNKITEIIIDAGLVVHKTLGPGLLEKVYHECLIHELRLRDLNVKSELSVPIKYKNNEFDAGFRLDLLVENSIIVEIKAVVDLNPVFKSQVLTYLKLMHLKIGLLLNFNVPLFKNGIYRLIN